MSGSATGGAGAAPDRNESIASSPVPSSTSAFTRMRYFSSDAVSGPDIPGSQSSTATSPITVSGASGDALDARSRRKATSSLP